MARPNFFLDMLPRQEQPTDSTLTGVVVEDLGGGKVAVAVDGAPDDWPPVVAVSEAGLTGVGARVRLPRDSSGRVVAASSPLSLPEGAVPVPVGVTGRAVVEALEAARAAGAGLVEAQAKADAAAADAVAAMVAAGKVVTVAAVAPESPAEGQLWAVTEAGSARIVGLRLWTGSEWVAYALLADSVIVPGSVGTIALADGAVTAPKVLASDELWANLLTVAGDATIGGSLLAEIITGKTLIGSQVIATQGERDVANAGQRLAAADAVATDTGWTLPLGELSGKLDYNIADVVPAGVTDPGTWQMRVMVVDKGSPRVYARLSRPTGSQTSQVELLDSEWVTLSGVYTGADTLFRLSLDIRGAEPLPMDATLHVERVRVYQPASQVALRNLDDGTPVVVYEDVDSGLHTVMSPDRLTITQAGQETRIPWRNVGLAIAPPRAYLEDNTARNVGNANWNIGTLVPLQLENGMTGASSGVTVPVSGYYRISARAKFAPNQTGRRVVGISVNGESPDTNTSVMASQGTTAVECNTSLYLEAGDLVQMKLFQQSGTVLSSPGRTMTIVFESEKRA
ncbi:hypothetical protein [Actinobaculum sp. 352]|uniref:hypothetical protein n=1 Tax=Actinobaculum sp. 352 TaxID=2490946 RepID=UPI000F7E1D26|nr:hypothetical protein [Actinobaculum sp. 352]RTE50384.1 hypothetical protein EKN07_04090 [Actinobaculum sp. 352]